MFKPSTLAVAIPLAESLCNENLLMVPKSDAYPVGIMANHYAVLPDPTYATLTPDTRKVLVNRFEELNNKQTDDAEAQYDALVELMAGGIQRMLVTARTVIAPIVSSIGDSFKSMVSVGSLPEISVTPYTYKAIHGEPYLIEHLISEYDNIKQLESYRTFRMEYPGAEKIIEWAQHNQHASAESIKAWLLSMAPDAMESVWYSLFGGDRQIYPDNLWAISRAGRPDNIDQLLLAYFLTVYLHHEPQEVKGESVSLEEWEEAFKYLHRFLGANLRAAYQQRALEKTKQRVILRSEYNDSRHSTVLAITVNGDVFADWLAAGGDVKQLLGAAVSAPQLQHAADLDAAKDDLISVWDRKHYMLKQTTTDRMLSSRRRYLAEFLKGNFTIDETTLAELPKLEAGELTSRIQSQLSLVSDKDFDDVDNLVMRLVCDVYYPGTPYKEFLSRMNKVSAEQDLNAREAALFATVEMVAAWLGDQVCFATYTCDNRDVFSDSSAEVPAVVEETNHDSDVSTAA